MILCHCNVVTHEAADAAIARMREGSPDVTITPGRVHKQLGVRPKCGRCTRHLTCLIKEAADAPHARHSQKNQCIHKKMRRRCAG